MESEDEKDEGGENIGQDEHGSCGSSIAGQGALLLDQCIQALLKEEQLGEDDQWYCNQCKKHVQAKKSLGLWYRHCYFTNNKKTELIFV